ncbi:MAG: EAL domain-containing protein [Candidatus Thiodiazotropha sp. (ex Monitilora ramsayi)]|nr:EAL domain-containing protein [Candidatus Thiodiazotropha sp. (ex Monitilora ramsayi)]
MKQERILTILYDLALVIGSADHVDALLMKVLQRLIFHTGYPCGLALQWYDDEPEDEEYRRVLLQTGIGDHRLNTFLGKSVRFPTKLVAGEADEISIEDIQQLPLKQDHYRSALRLPVPGYGVVLLLTPVVAQSEAPFTEIFKPVLANLAKAIVLCERNEAYTKDLIADRDAARFSNERFRRAMDSAQDAIYLIDPETMRFIDFNRQASETLGYTSAELCRLHVHDIMVDVGRDQLTNFFKRTIREGHTRFLSSHHRRKDGTAFSAEIHVDALEQVGSEPVIIAVARDIEERKGYEEALFEEKERALVTLQSIGDAVITTDRDGIITYMNPVAETLTGYTIEEVKDKSLEKAFQVIDEISRSPAINPVDACLSRSEVISLAHHSLLISRDGREIAIEDSAAPIRQRDGTIIGVVIVFHDVSRARELAHKLTWQASHDSMTGLVNRAEFERRLRQTVDQAQQEKDHHALLYIDLDQFKIVNDTCGHVAGDELLKQLAVLMRELVRESDTLARLGGDEFGVLLSNCDRSHALRVANLLRERIKDHRFVWQDRVFEVGASIGIVEINEISSDISQVLSQADMACYAAKDDGRNRVHVFELNDDALMRRHSEMLWVSKITEAMEHERFVLYWQAISPLQETESAGWYEALIRMRDEHGHLIMPGAFIPAAERYNLMPTLDRWVIQQTFHTCSEYCHAHTAESPEISINLSGASINDESTSDYILEQLQAFDIDPEQICFEITETAAISNLTRAYRLIHDLKAMGFRFALDDFGSGVSSFTYLKNLPVDYLKIDGSFVKDMLSDPVDESMVEMINQIGHVMGLETIAEYAESDEIVERLKILGIDFAQGFALHKPMDVGLMLSAENGLIKRRNSAAAPPES